MVMAGDSYSEGCGLKSHQCKLDEFFLNIFDVKIVVFV